jgi:hypothetical protein
MGVNAIETDDGNITETLGLSKKLKNRKSQEKVVKLT